jgi:sterol 3beta-glucosyltransferase
LFPRCAAVVHHAGAGTTHTTLAAGAPSVPVPHVSDQFGWADDLQRLGVAPRALPRRALTAPRLAARIRSVLATPPMKQRAVAMAARMKDDDGVKTAVRMIEEIA